MRSRILLLAVVLIGSLATGQQTVTPQDYGAVGDVSSYFDGALSAGAVKGATGISNTPMAPSITTNASNEFVVSIFLTSTAGWSSFPSTGSNRVNVPQISGKYGAYANDQSIVSPGTVAAVSGTTSASMNWDAATISLIPNGTIAFVNASSAQQATGTSISLTAPVGLTDGMFIIACLENYNTSAITFPPSFLVSGQKLLALKNTGNDYLTCYSKIAGSEPATYTWTQSTNTGMTAFILAYSNVAGVDGAIITSATGPFLSADVNKPICSVISNTAQQCGNIIKYLSSTQVATSLPATAPYSSAWFSYGTDDTAALQSMLTTAPCSTSGCKISLGNHRYGITGPLTFPPNVPIVMEGNGAGSPNTPYNFLSGFPIANANVGTGFWVLSQGLARAALTFSGGSTSLTNTTAFDSISDFTVYGGAGENRDGCGSDGLAILNWQGFSLKNVYVANCSGNGVLIDALSNSTYLSYIEGINLTGLYSFWNGNNGVNIGGVTGARDVETIKIDSSIIESNGRQGIYLASSIEGLVIQNTVIQWNNQVSPGTEIYNSNGAHILGCEIAGNYFEKNSTTGSQTTSWINTATFGVSDNCSYGTNFYNNGSTKGLANPFYSDPLGVTHVASLVSLVVSGSGTSPAINASFGSWQITLSGNTSPTMTGIFKGLTWNALICQPGSGGPYTLTWPSSVHGGPVITTNAGHCTTQQFYSFDGSTLTALPIADVN